MCHERGDGSACAVATEDDAEWMPDGVNEDPEPCLRLTWRTSGAKRPELLLGLIRVIHANVEMQLLGMRWIRPARRDPFGDPLESQLSKTRL